MTVSRRPASSRPTRTAVVPLSRTTASPPRSSSATAAANASCHAQRHDAIQVAADRHLRGAEGGCHLGDVEPPVALKDLDHSGEALVRVHVV